MATRHCSGVRADGGVCGAAPLHESAYCLLHDPAHAEEVAEARRLGGQRRRRERVLNGAYELSEITGLSGIRRVVEISLLDTLGLENSVARNRTLAYLALVALKVHEAGDVETRLATLEQAVMAREALPPGMFTEQGADGDLDGRVVFVTADADLAEGAS